MAAQLSSGFEAGKQPFWLLEWLLVVAALVLFTVTETFGPGVTLGLVLLAIFFLERGLRGRLISMRSGLEMPILLFIASAGISFAVSFAQGAALLQFARILGSAALFFALADSRKPVPEIIAAGFVLAAVGLAIYWPLHNDFSLSPGKLPVITAIGEWLNSKAAIPFGPDIHGNVAAGTLLASVPLAAGLAWLAWQSKRSGFMILAVLQVVILLFGLIMTSSRGAWVGLAGMVLLAALVTASRTWTHSKNQKVAFWIGILVLGLAVLLAISLSGNFNQILGQIPDPSGSMRSRLTLWQEGLSLARDYFFTGSGLQTFWMVHAVYGILVHVPFIAHSHNSLLQIWIEQGILGAAAVCWGITVLMVSTWRALDQPGLPILGWAGLIAITGGILHGMIDVVFSVERTLPVVGLLLGFMTLLRWEIPKEIKQPASPLPARLALAAAAGLLLVSFWIFRGPLAAAWYANMGALTQTRTELGLYDPDHFDDPTLDQVRRSSNLSAAQSDFEKSLAFQPANLTSLQRLSMIALARAEYPQALAWMERAWRAGDDSSVTRLLFSDALVAAGQPEAAASIAFGLTWAESRLLGQAWTRYSAGQDYRRAAYAYRTVLLLNPANKTAASELSKLQLLLNQ